MFADEMIGQMRFLLNGFALDEKALAIDVIDRVGIGGNYITDDHTLDNCAKTTWYPEMIDHGNHSMWQTTGARDLGSKVKDKAQKILHSHQPEPLAPDIIRRLKNIAE